MKNEKNIENIEEEKKKRKKYLLLLLLLLLIIILKIIYLWYANNKPTAILGTKDEEDNNTVIDNVINTPIENETTDNTVVNNNTTNKQEDETNKVDTSTSEEAESPEEPIEMEKEFTVTSKKEKWTEKLNIFNNEKYDGKPVIYPGISNTYYFELNNKLDNDVICKINFAEKNVESLPIMYKLKENGTYIKGSKNQYVSYDELNLSNIILTSKSENVYTLEWKWIDDGKQTNQYGDIGKTITYQLGITIEAEEKVIE